MAEESFDIKSDSPVVGDLMFWSLVGHEGFSRPSYYELTVLSKDKTLDAKDILGRGFEVVIEFEDADGGKKKRHCHGFAVRFTRLRAVGRFFEYRIVLRSWFWLLTKRRNSRILQDMAIVDVVNAVFDDSAISRVRQFKSDHVIATHEPRRYCVQFEESDYDFLSRLLEDEGIYYWFDVHDEPGTMHLSDASDAAHTPLDDPLRHVAAGRSEARFNEVSEWISSRQFDTGKTASRDSNFKTIRKKLQTERDVSDDHELSDFEAFEFPGLYFDDDAAETVAKVRGEELQGRRDRHWALTPWPDVAVGRRLKFSGDPDGTRDGEYLIAGCTFVVTHPGYEGMGGGDSPGAAGVGLRDAIADSVCDADTRDAVEAILARTPSLNAAPRGSREFLLTLLPAAQPYRPPRLTPHKPMPGPQTAIVVGPAGDEIHADDFGRVKVHFHWDRYDESNEKSTCWVRVSQPWAGKGWGGYFIPRIGQEVIVDFLNGDAERPFVIGRVYNDDQPKPFDSHTQSGFRTRSTPGGSAATCNEFRFDDKKGSEQVYLHAEKNQDISVENDETHTVGHDRTKTIDHDETTLVKHDRTETVGNNEKITIGVNRRETVGSNETIGIGLNRTETVGVNETITIGSNRTVIVGASEAATVALQRTHTVGVNETITVGAAQEITIGALQAVIVGANQTVSVGVNQSTDVGANRSVTVGSKLTTSVGSEESRSVGSGRTTSVGKDDALTVGKNLSITAADSISIVTGSASITMKKDGTIVIKGKDITVEGSGKINVKASSDVIIKGSKILQN